MSNLRQQKAKGKRKMMKPKIGKMKTSCCQQQKNCFICEMFYTNMVITEHKLRAETWDRKEETKKTITEKTKLNSRQKTKSAAKWRQEQPKNIKWQYWSPRIATLLYVSEEGINKSKDTALDPTNAASRKLTSALKTNVGSKWRDDNSAKMAA